MRFSVSSADYIFTKPADKTQINVSSADYKKVKSADQANICDKSSLSIIPEEKQLLNHSLTYD